MDENLVTQTALRYTAPLDWADLDMLVDRYCAALAQDATERTSMFGVAMNTGAPQLCVIAILAEKRLNPEGSVAWVEAFLESALKHLQAQTDEQIHDDWLRSYLSAGGDPDAIEVRSRLDQKIDLETAGEHFDAARARLLLDAGLASAPLAVAIYTRARDNDHIQLARRALAVLSQTDTEDSERLGRQLEAGAERAVKSGNPGRAAHLLADLKILGQMASGAAPIVKRTVDELSVQLRAGNTQHLADVRLLDSSEPTAIFLDLRDAVVKGDRATGAKRLEDLNDKDFKVVLVEARKAVADRDDVCGLLLYEWLGARNQALPEVEKAHVQIANIRRIALREARDAAPEAQLRAAEAHLEVAPQDARSLWIRSRLLGKLRAFEEAYEALGHLLAVDAEYPGADVYKDNLEQRLKRNTKT